MCACVCACALGILDIVVSDLHKCVTHSGSGKKERVEGDDEGEGECKWG